MGSPSIPAPVKQEPPAPRAQRIVEVEPEDVVLGTSDATEGTDTKTKGKRSLTRPTGANTSSSGATSGGSSGAQV